MNTDKNFARAQSATNELDGMIPSTIGQLPYLTSLRLGK